MRITLLALVFLAGCSTTSRHKGPPVFSRVIHKDVESGYYCPDAKEGALCPMTWSDAVKFCEVRGSHLPSARDFALSYAEKGTRLLNKTKAERGPPPGYYLIDAQNADNTFDSFYLNQEEYKPGADDAEAHALWSSSFPTMHRSSAFVFSDKLGGATGDSNSNQLNHPHAVRCAFEGEAN